MPDTPARLPVVAPAEIDLDAARLERAYELLDGWTRRPDAAIPGGAILIGRHGKTVATRRFGHQGPEPDAEPIRDDVLFLLASISKPITYLGAMLLVERGHLRLTDRVTHYVPEFAAHHKEDTLVAHLFTHTSGLPDMLANNVELRKQHAPLARFVHGAIRDTVPLFPPGSSVSYQSMGTLMVAHLVEKITGTPLPEFLEAEIFHPLGLESTRLGLRGMDRARVARVQVPEYLSAGRNDYDWNSPYWQDLGSPWGGLFSTPEEFAVLCQLMLGGGQYGGVRLFSRSTIERMTTNRLDDFPDIPEPLRRTQPWGLGWRLNHPGTDDSWGDLLGPRTFGHTGATGTTMWMDPDLDGFCILFTTGLRAAAPWRLVSLSNIIAGAFQ